MLANLRELLKDAQEKNYAVGSFSVANMEMILGVIKAAEETRSPIILQIAEVRLNHSPLALIGPMMLAAAEEADVPVAVHLDHGTTLECISQALDIGFTSVMFDGSHLPLEENIRITKEALYFISFCLLILYYFLTIIVSENYSIVVTICKNIRFLLIKLEQISRQFWSKKNESKFITKKSRNVYSSIVYDVRHFCRKFKFRRCFF